MKKLMILLFSVLFSFNVAFGQILSLPEIRIDLPTIKIPQIKIPAIKIPNIKLPEIRIPEIRIAHIEIGNIRDINIAHVELGRIDLPRIDIPEIKLAHIEVGNLNIPEVNLMRVEVDLENDLRNPGQFYSNIGAELTSIKADIDRELTVFKANTDWELTVAKKNVDRELTDMYHDLKQTSEKAYEDTKRELDQGITKTGQALEAAGKPENLARIAVVYAASVYGGPLGSAMANALMDKLQNPGMSDEDLFKSFVVGAASGYAAESVTVLPSGVTKNLAKDLGNVIIKGESLRAEDLLTSIATGYAKVEGGDTFIANVLESSAQSAVDYSIETLIDKEKFDQEAFSNALVNGLANGLTRESVHQIMDEYVVKYIPEEHKRLDKKLIEKMKQQYADLFLSLQERKIEIEMSKLRSLNMSEKERIAQFFNRKRLEYMELIRQELIEQGHENVTFVDIQSEMFRRIDQDFEHFIAEDKEFEQINSMVMAPKFEGDIREPNASTMAAVMLVISSYCTYMTLNDANELYQKYRNSNQDLGEFIRDNKMEVGILTAEALMAFAGPTYKLIKTTYGTKVTAKAFAYASKYNIVNEADILKLAKVTKGLEKLPSDLPVDKIVMGKDGSKVAVIGRKMDGVVNTAVDKFKEAGLELEKFRPSKKAQAEFDRVVQKFRNYNGSNPNDANVWLPNDVLKKTLMYKENAEWINKVRVRGYTVIDMGNPGKLDASIFYDMEKTVIYGN